MEDKIANSIVLHQMTIKELEEIKKNVKENIDDTVRFRIETRLEFGGWDPHITRVKNKLEVSPRTMLLILDEAKKKEKEKIDKLIDMEIEKRVVVVDTVKEKPIANTTNDDLCIQFIKDYLNKTDKPNCFFYTLYEKCKVFCEEHSSEMISRKRLSLCLKQLGCVIKSKKNSDNTPYRYIWFDDIII